MRLNLINQPFRKAKGLTSRPKHPKLSFQHSFQHVSRDIKRYQEISRDIESPGMSFCAFLGTSRRLVWISAVLAWRFRRFPVVLGILGVLVCPHCSPHVWQIGTNRATLQHCSIHSQRHGTAALPFHVVSVESLHHRLWAATGFAVSWNSFFKQLHATARYKRRHLLSIAESST